LKLLASSNGEFLEKSVNKKAKSRATILRHVGVSSFGYDSRKPHWIDSF
jgi:hypothetical protein